MDRLNNRQLGLIFTGSFLGTGFVSGQEILQFFGVFGKMGIVGMFVSIILFGTFGYFFMYIAKKEKITAIDQIIMGDGKTILHCFLNGISLLFLFGVIVIMLAGAGSLINELFGIPYFVGSACLAMLLAPAAQRTPDMKTVIKGIVQGAIQLLLMFACILLSLQRFYGLITNADFPMQALAGQINPAFGGIYAVLLLAAMFSGALACMYGALVQLFGEQNQGPVEIVVLWGIAFVCSLAGFKGLISVIFPVCGYAYLIAMPLTIRRFVKLRKNAE